MTIDPNGQHALEDKGEVIFKNGAVYKGQRLGDIKHGYDVQVWPDGALRGLLAVQQGVREGQVLAR